MASWLDAARATGGRVAALGRRPDYRDLVAAADVYLDSFPVGSLYSLLEPALAGVPAVSFARLPADAAVLMSDDPGLDGRLPRPTDEAEYLEIVRALTVDAALRAELGHALADGVAATHTGPSWQAAFQAVVEQAETVHAERCAGREVPSVDPALEQPATTMPSLALAWLPEAQLVPPDRVRVELPLARA
jgi:hypothetical protein